MKREDETFQLLPVICLHLKEKFVCKGSKCGKFINGGKPFRQQKQASQQRNGKYTFSKQNLLKHELNFWFNLNVQSELGKFRKIIDIKVGVIKQCSKRLISRKTYPFLKRREENWSGWKLIRLKIDQVENWSGWPSILDSVEIK